MNQEIVIIDKQNFSRNEKMFEDLILDFYKKNNENYTKNQLGIKNQIENKNVCYCVIKKGNNPVSLCRFVKMFDRKTFYVIRQINTLKEYQNQGLGTVCFDEISSYLKQKQAKKVFSFVEKNNIPSQKMHQKSGFEKIIPNKTLKRTNYCFDGSICFCKKFK